MRLSVFIAKIQSPQLIIDLQKIYNHILPEASLTEAAFNNMLSDTSSNTYVTMFNERHIGAVKVHINTTQAILSQLCIRDITRRRGIGKNLLKQIEKELTDKKIKNIQYDLKEVSQEEILNTEAFLLDSGYSVNDSIASKQL